ncbi:hypothetical protein BDD43_4712 [Mucilaginibacter gracilis]|uniref:Lipoprotein n=1 Tax=Mucilaginibacter gracilis TaxID=423350 RepID=A0A495J7Y6_9SPHI|nr:hypothetical protein [Mucilaginibacter gracilis]RKR84474.1 hypothetical protein BDD43_4712 [Mucilaginibacter gracilis]
MNLIKHSKHLFILLLFISIYSCHENAINGMLSASSDIKDSKKRGVFVKEYIGQTNPIKINDSLSITIKSAWLEQMWRGDGPSNEKAKVQDHGYQLLVVTDKECLKNYRDTWMIGLNADGYFRRASEDAIIVDFKTLPKASILEWQVQNGYSLSRNDKKTIIGKFALIAKK